MDGWQEGSSVQEEGHTALEGPGPMVDTGHPMSTKYLVWTLDTSWDLH